MHARTHTQNAQTVTRGIFWKLNFCTSVRVQVFFGSTHFHECVCIYQFYFSIMSGSHIFVDCLCTVNSWVLTISMPEMSFWPHRILLLWIFFFWFHIFLTTLKYRVSRDQPLVSEEPACFDLSRDDKIMCGSTDDHICEHHSLKNKINPERQCQKLIFLMSFFTEPWCRLTSLLWCSKRYGDESRQGVQSDDGLMDRGRVVVRGRLLAG